MASFTREQTLALLTDRHIAVTANAGSGKTTVLVERYVRLLLQGVDIRSIVAITFTRKAAAEMRLRVAKRLEEEFMKALDAGNEKQAIFIRHLRERLNIALISTIHSFCAHILRDYPVEAQINPLFSALDEFDGAALREETIALIAEECLQSEDKEIADTYYRLFRMYGINTLHSIVDSLLQDGEKLSELRNLYAKSNTEILASKYEIIDKQCIQPLIMPIGSIVTALSIMQQSGVKQNSQIVAIMSYAPKILELQGLLTQSQKDNEHLKKISQIFQELFTLLFTNSGEPRKKVLDYAEQCHVSELLFSQIEILQNSYSFFSSIESWHHDDDIVETARGIFDFVERCSTRITQEKIYLSALDFNDLQQKLLTILEIDDVRYDIQRRYSYIMVDEFQDTNKLQFQLTSKLIYALSQPIIQRDIVHSNMYIVGDPKQSIYRFRGADVRVFESAKKAVIALNTSAKVLDIIQTDSMTIHLEEREKHGDIRLTTTFRLMPEIAFFVNTVCASIMHEQTAGYFVGYDETICSRSFLPSHKGSVSLVIGEKVKEDSHFDTQHIKQDHALARYLRECVLSPTPLLIEEKGTLRPVEWSDIVIVARKNDVLDSLAVTLREYEIPCYVPQGKRFYSRQEIRDIVAYLSFLTNPADDFAFTTIARSPFFELSDEQLLNIFYASDEVSLWEKCVRYCEIHSLQQGAIYDTVNILRELLPLSSRLSLPILLQTILEKSHWFLRIKKEKDIERKIANIHKLIAFAREFEASGFKGLFEFSERLQSLVAMEVQESDAQTDLHQNAVPLITIHSSKGLEFPVVVVYDMNSGDIQSSLRQVTIDERFGIICKPTIAEYDHARNTKQLRTVHTPLTQLAVKDTMLAEQAEQERLLYVALTRAKDHLILVANITRNIDNLPAKTKGLFSMIERVFDDGYFYGKPILLEGTLPAIIDGEMQRQKFSLTIPVIRYSNREEYTFDTVSLEESPQQPERHLLLDTIVPLLRDEQYSATKFKTFANDPMAYYLHYAIGLPPETMTYDEKYSIMDDSDSVTGSLAGQCLHAVMQDLPQWYKHGVFDKNVLETLCISIGQKSEQEISQEIIERVMRESEAIVSTQLLNRFSHSVHTARFEEKYYFPIENDFLLAVFDCLIANENGEIEVWDWKTNVIHSDKDMDTLLQEYMTQLEMYAYFVMNLFPEQETLTLRLLFTRKARLNAPDEEWTRALFVDKSMLKEIEKRIQTSYAAIRNPLSHV